MSGFRRNVLACLIVAIVVSSVALALAYSGGGQVPGAPSMNLPMPTINLASVTPGAPSITMADFQQPAVVLNFWGSWCPSCQAEMPTLEAAHRRLGDHVTFIGIDEQDTRSSALNLLRRVGVTYPNGFDRSGSLARSFDLPGAPVTYFISHGLELDAHVGPLTQTVLNTYLLEYFGVRA
jgi:thiol-disulfide isomerase/thioredoxin